MSCMWKSKDSYYCGVCGAILPEPATAPSDVNCRVCSTALAKYDELVCRVEKVYQRTVADTENAADLGDAEAVVDHVCTKCAHNKAMYSTMQTRSADEGQTVFYTCVKCKKKDIEYS